MCEPPTVAALRVDACRTADLVHPLTERLMPLPAQAWSLLDGFWLSVTGLLIVFSALVLVSVFIAWLPRGLETINRIFPEPPDHHQTPSPPRKAGDVLETDLVVAIAAALEAHRRR